MAITRELIEQFERAIRASSAFDTFYNEDGITLNADDEEVAAVGMDYDEGIRQLKAMLITLPMSELVEIIADLVSSFGDTSTEEGNWRLEAFIQYLKEHGI